ncbi:EAL domain-containing protein [Lysobacter korlensis]|uniref:EAL domain-containing protein n=1 Tax=Lysobacter korlensis TaxID=553636 RepID=A0ABV6RLP3_9GAMM
MKRVPQDSTRAVDVGAALGHVDRLLQSADLSGRDRNALQSVRDTLAAIEADAPASLPTYRELFNAMPDPVTVLDMDGVVLELNDAALRAFRQPRDEVIGRPIHELNPDLPRDHMGPVREAVNRGERYLTEVTNKRADGTRFPVEVHSARLDYDGHRYVVAVARDLTSRRSGELRYRELMELVDKGILIRDETDRVVHANAAAMRMFEVGDQPVDEAFRREHWLIINEDGRELEADELPAVLARTTGRVIGSTVLGYYHRVSRRLIWVSVTAVPQFAPDTDRVQQVMTLFSDVTALKRDSSLFDRAQALAHIGGWEWEPGQDRLYLTDEAQRILGREPAPRTMDELLGSLRESDRRELRDALDAALADTGELDVEVLATRGDGHSVWIRMIGESDTNQPLQARLTGTLQDVTERRQGEETLRVQSRTDPLTTLLNRDALLSELDVRLADPTQTGVAVLYVDLDRFKVVNDLLGHAAGDGLLASAAHRIQHAVGSEGLTARFGGDEFLIVCNTRDDPGRPQRLAQAIVDAFNPSFRLDDDDFNVTASVGIALASMPGTTAQALIQNADVAMFESKRRGRNGWQLFTQPMAEQQQHRLQLENKLRRATEKGEFRLVYQPQIDLTTGVLVGVEALIRWKNQTLGEIRPDRFIEHAEATGDIVGIGGWALREACRQMREWLDAGVSVPRVAVNVSYRQFLAEDLAGNVRAALEEHRLPGAALELEFTERVLIEDVPDTLRAFAALRELGVALSIDDFGEGYSALNYLRRLPIHGVKISKLFVEGVPENDSDVAVCRAVAGIAQSLGLDVVAEGVENERQRECLRQMGIATGQGYLFAPALQPDEIEARYGRLLTTR